MIKKRLSKIFTKKALALVLTTGFCLTGFSTAKAETIGLSIPLSGDVAEVGRKFRLGAKLAMEKLGTGHKLFIADDGCDVDLAQVAARDISQQNPAIVTGLICNVAAISTANQLREKGVPVLIAGARSIRLIKDREREEWNLWRLSPGDDAPAHIAAEYIIKNLKDTPFAIVDDGTIYGRSLTDALRLKLNEEGMSPQFTDTFRAAQSTQAGLLRRLERSDVSVAFIAATTMEDLETIVKNHKSLGMKYRLIVTDQLAVLPFLENGEEFSNGAMVVMEPPIETLKNATILTDLLKERNIEADKAIYDGYAAIELAIASLGKSASETAHNLDNKRFETIKGSVEFAANGNNIHNPYAIYIWQQGKLKLLNDLNSL